MKTLIFDIWYSGKYECYLLEGFLFGRAEKALLY
jgi:hypothetical protein